MGETMKLQISYDFTDLDKALEVAKQTAEYADILEVGSLLIYKNGSDSVFTFKKQFPDKKILADAKLVDRVNVAVPLFCEDAADYLTVLAGTSDTSIQQATQLAHSFDTLVMLDLLDAYSMGQSALDAEMLGVDCILFHKAHEESDAIGIIDLWQEVRGNTRLPIFISGGIDQESVEKITDLKPNGVVIGSAITMADNPAKQAEYFKSLITK
jgi:3-hexulose-6-phosphate synthase